MARSVAYVSVSIYLSITFEAKGMRGERNLSFTSVITTTSDCLLLCWSVQCLQEHNNKLDPFVWCYNNVISVIRCCNNVITSVQRAL